MRAAQSIVAMHCVSSTSYAGASRHARHCERPLGHRKSMRTFFPKRQPKTIGLAVFLNAGDPPLEHLEDLMLLLDTEWIDCLELAVPFPDSLSDGPAIRRSSGRAIQRGIALGNV